MKSFVDFKFQSLLQIEVKILDYKKPTPVQQ